jgi:hypothetical protein
VNLSRNKSLANGGKGGLCIVGSGQQCHNTVAWPPLRKNTAANKTSAGAGPMGSSKSHGLSRMTDDTLVLVGLF